MCGKPKRVCGAGQQKNRRGTDNVGFAGGSAGIAEIR
jgi:hypothetical protein